MTSFVVSPFTVFDRAGGRLENAPCAIFVADAIFEAFAASGGAGFLSGFQHALLVVRMYLIDRRSLEFFRGVAQDTLIGRAVVKTAAPVSTTAIISAAFSVINWKS